MSEGTTSARLLAALALLGFASLAAAHPLAPALLELRETSPEQFDVLWRTSVTRVQGVDVAPQLPEDCTALAAPRAALEDNEAMTLRWQVLCAGGLGGRTIRVTGLDRAAINVILRIEFASGASQQALLDARTPAYLVTASALPSPVFPRYLSLGVGHLLSGLDHVLFVVGLFLLVRGSRPLVLTITAFTAGHSVTLGLATMGILEVPAAPVEVGIALSILWLACELAGRGFTAAQAAGTGTAPVGASAAATAPWRLAAAFGLLHGLGFAGALADAGMPAGEVPIALLAFNLGIEAGQLLLLGLLAALGSCAVWLTPKLRLAAPARAVATYAIGGLAAYWCLERGAAWL